MTYAGTANQNRCICGGRRESFARAGACAVLSSLNILECSNVVVEFSNNCIALRAAVACDPDFSLGPLRLLMNILEVNSLFLHFYILFEGTFRHCISYTRQRLKYHSWSKRVDE